MYKWNILLLPGTFFVIKELCVGGWQRWAKYGQDVEQGLDFGGCYTHKKRKIYGEKAAVLRKFRFCEEIDILSLKNSIFLKKS